MQARGIRTTGLGALVAILALAVGGPIQAQEQGESQAPAQDVPTVEQEELRTYARAYVEVADVRAELQQKLAQASQEEQAQIRQRANQEMQGILQDHSLSVQRYQEITSTLNADPEQRATFTSMVEEIQAEEEDDGDPPSGR